MTTPMSASALGALPYDDVYLDQISSDDEDEEEIGENVNISLNKPLMSPRKKRRPKIGLRQPRKPTVWQVRQQKRCLKAFYVIMMLSVISLVTFVLFRITHDYEVSVEEEKQISLTNLQNGSTIKISHHQQKEEIHVELFPCTSFDVEDVWTQNFPMYETESATRLVDVNKDGTLDIIMAFATDMNGYFVDENLMCGIYYNDVKPCFGGTMALDGKTGDELWTHRTRQEIFALNCNVDIDNDGVKDCLCSGRTGLFMLLSGATGELIWDFKDNPIFESISNLYTAQFIQDMDSDGVQDVINIHGGDPFRQKDDALTEHIGKLVIFSGKDGHVINWVEMPDNVESYYSPQVYYKKSGVPMVLFGSGGEALSGSLWVMPLHDILIRTTRNAKRIYMNDVKGVMTPPVLLDMTGDGVLDIVMRMFSIDTVAFDGETYKQIWKSEIHGSESYSTPGVGYFNDDDIPDFMIQSNIGPGYPIYYNSETTILDGRDGQPLFQPVKGAGSVFSSPLVISMEGHGHDTFIYFNLDCLGHEGQAKQFEILDDGGKGDLSRIDFCQSRFGTETYTRLMALNSHMKRPGHVIYNSLDRKSLEYLHKVNSTHLAKAYLNKHPDVMKMMLKIALERDHEDDEETEDGYHPTSPKMEDDNLGDDLENMLPQATTGLPLYTKQNYQPNSPTRMETFPSTMSSRGSILTPINEDDRDNDGDDENYSELLDKLQSIINSMDVKSDDDDIDDLEVTPHRTSFTTGYTTPQKYTTSQKYTTPQKSPVYTRPGWGYASPNYKDDSMSTPSIYSKLLEKYPWLVDELSESLQEEPEYQQHRHKQSSGYGPQKPSKSHDSDTWLPRRQWGRQGDLWSRKRRDDIAAKEGHIKNHVYKRSTKQRHNDEIRSKTKQSIQFSKQELPLNHQFHTHSKKSQPFRTGEHVRNYQERLHKLLNSKLGKHLNVGAKRQSRNRSKRHAGSHDDNGVMRLLSTGALVPPLHGVDSSRSIDLVFATYWSYPSIKKIRLPEENECLDLWTANETLRLMPDNRYYGLDHDAYEDEAERHCIVNKGVKATKAKEKMLKSMNPLEISPFNIHNGEMTVYRLRLTCKCGLKGGGTYKKRCAKILPFKEQQWGGYMGTFGNSHFKKHKLR